MTLVLSSPAFPQNGSIPEEHTCDGEDTPPPLTWNGVPSGAKSLALVVDDPDAPDPKAPKRTYVHWVLYNLPPDATGIPAGGHPLPPGTRQGVNDWKRADYGGPCPSIGRHRYFFKLYALDVTLDHLDTPTKGELEAAIQGHVLARADIVGTYERAAVSAHRHTAR